MRRFAPVVPGSTLGFVAPSGALRGRDGLPRAIDAARGLGFHVVVGQSCRSSYGYLAGPDELRAADINEMFARDDVDAVVCIRGGYGAQRILEMIDYAAAKAHPKAFLGYSDVTALHIALYQRANLVTLHGPMPASDWIGEGFDAFSLASALGLLAGGGDVEGSRLVNPEGYPLVKYAGGVAEGPLVGGNLSLVSGLCGTKYALDAKGCILFLEDIGEKTYRLDHMLTQLRDCGVFDACAGVLLGSFCDCPVEYPEFGLTLDEIVRDIVLPSGKPVLGGLCAGHASPKMTLPLGARLRMDAGAGEMTFVTAE